jgi:hypothetical protein
MTSTWENPVTGKPFSLSEPEAARLGNEVKRAKAAGVRYLRIYDNRHRPYAGFDVRMNLYLPIRVWRQEPTDEPGLFNFFNEQTGAELLNATLNRLTRVDPTAFVSFSRNNEQIYWDLLTGITSSIDPITGFQQQ